VAETVLNQQEQKSAPVDGQKQNAFLKKTVGLILSAVMIGLTVYIFSLQKQNYNVLSHTNELFAVSSSRQAANYRSYVAQYKDTKQQLEETTKKLEAVQKELDRVTAQLAATRGMLSDTQTMLSQAQTENSKLKSEIQDLDTLRSTENVNNIPELEAKINTLKEKNAEVTSELGSLKSELRTFQAEFSNREEGRPLIILFQNKIKLVKSRMRHLQQEAYLARAAAQKERDRLAALNGNSGYLVKDGQAKKPAAKRYAIDVKIVP